MLFIKDTNKIELESIDEVREQLLLSQGYVKHEEVPQEYLELKARDEENKIVEAKVSEAIAYLRETDWCQRYIDRHNDGIELLDEGSNKLLIEVKRKEALKVLA